MNFYKIVLLAFLAFFTTGCISTKVTGVKDSKYTNHNIQHILVSYRAASIENTQLAENSFEELFKKHGIKTSKFSYLFPITRKYSSEEIKNKIKDLNIDTYLVLEKATDSSSNTLVGMNHTFNAYQSGSSIYGTGHSTPLIYSRRNTFMNIALFDTQTGDTIWKGESKTEAGGKLYVQDDDTIESIVNSFVGTLKEENVIK